MHRVNDTNLNDADYWDGIYLAEWGSGKRRIDEERLSFLVNAMRDWHQYSPQITAPKLLDVGCGNGELLRLVHANLPDWDLTGVDITPKTLSKAQAVDPNFHYSVANAYELPFDSTFNVVFCGETLEHLENPQAAVDQLLKAVTPGGYLVCSIPLNHNNYSPEHINEFSVWDAINLTTKGDVNKLKNIDVKCGGISTIWVTQK